ILKVHKARCVTVSSTKNGGSGVPLEKIQIRGNIKGFTAEVLAIMEYKNNSDSPIEAIYVFPLDEEAAVCGFQATIDGRTIVAEIQEKQEARDTYDDAISSGHSAFLLEESDESSDIFFRSMLEKPTTKTVSYSTVDVRDNTERREGRKSGVLLPAVLNPRYSPSDSKPSVSTTLPTIASVSSKYSFDFVLEVQCASLIEEITSPCNPLKVDITQKTIAKQQFDLARNFKFDADVQVHVLCSKPFEPHALVENGVIKLKDGIKDEFLSKPVVMLNFFRSWTVLQVLTEVFLDRFFLLTDGRVGNTQQVIELVRTNATRARCFTFGIGAGASTALVKGVARAGKGMAEFVASGDKLRAKVIKVLKNALQPALLDCQVTWDLPEGRSAKNIPDVPPPIFSGNSLIMYGLVSDDSLNAVDSNSKGSITLSATLAIGAKVEKIQHQLRLESLSSKSGHNSLLLHRLAAKVLIQEKQDNDNNAALNEEIVNISKSANVVSKLTSFVAVDKDSNIPVSAPLAKPSLQYEFSRCFSSLMTPCGFMAPIRRCSQENFISPFSKLSYGPSAKNEKKTKKVKKSSSRFSDGELKSYALSASNAYDPTTEDLDESMYLADRSASSSTPQKGCLEIVSLQKASGAWQLTAQLASICGVTLDKLKQTCPSQLTTDNKDSLWATAIALSCLAGKFADQKDE
ncbi:hypothetical protein QZH41_019313, partial [Actinostola sp. cb2023]